MRSGWGRAFGARLDRGAYALFSRHADRPRHDRDRDRHRGAALSVGFETYLARVYALAWTVGLCAGGAVVALGATLDPALLDSLGEAAFAVVPGDGSGSVSPRPLLAACGLFAAGSLRLAVIGLGGVYLRFRSNARRAAIERSLPGAVRYLRALADGSEGRRAMLRRTADRDAYGETAEALDRVLETAALTGSLDTGLRNVARETPSRELLSPFLLRFREHATQGSASLRRYLRAESRMLSHRQSRARERADGYRRLLAKLFVASVASPALFVVAVAAASVLSAGPWRAALAPGGATVRATLLYACLGSVLAVGAAATASVARLRPRTQGRTYERPPGPETLSTALSNPASAAFVFAFPAVAAGWCLWIVGEPPANVALLGYAAHALPVGVVAIRRGRLDDRKDREMRDFVHAVAGYVGLGQPFGSAVETVSGEVSFDALQGDIDDLAFRLGLTTGTGDADARREALDRFVARVGTPLATQTVGLVTGALTVGSDAGTTFETLQTEIGSLYDRRAAFRSRMLLYAAIGWATALFVIGLVVAADAYALAWLARFSTTPDAGAAIASGAFGAASDGPRLYVLTQATAFACGWFSGVASRGRYAALFHSGALVVICYAVFAAFGAI